MEMAPWYRIDVLAVVAELGDSSGREVQIRLTEPPYEHEHTPSERVYRHLNRLAEEDLITKEKVIRENSYQITPEGRAFLEGRIRMLERALQ